MSIIAKPAATGYGVLLSAAAMLASVVTGCATQPEHATLHVEPTSWVDGSFVGRHYQTAHYDIYSTVADAEFESALPAMLEAAYASYAELLPPTEASATRLQTYVLGSRSEWERYVRRRFPARFGLYERILSGGFTEGPTSVSAYTTRSATLAIIAHEGWHQYAHTQVKARMPAWLSEGAACCFESIDLTTGRPRFTKRSNVLRANALREAVRPAYRLSVADLLTTSPGAILTQSDAGAANRYYAQAWALVAFLRYGQGRRHAESFDQLLSDLADGSYAARTTAARLAGDTNDLPEEALMFEVYFGASPEAIEADYFDFVIRSCGY